MFQKQGRDTQKFQDWSNLECSRNSSVARMAEIRIKWEQLRDQGRDNKRVSSNEPS